MLTGGYRHFTHGGSMDSPKWGGPPVRRRTVLETAAAVTALATIADGGSALAQPAQAAPDLVQRLPVTLIVNGQSHSLTLDTRTTLLDTLREHLDLTGSKKGCDHGQCGACTVLLNGHRINSCLTLAVMHDGDEITTIEGLGQPGNLSPLQAAFLHHDGYQCGYCTPGQICSATGMLAEVKAGAPSVVTADLAAEPRLTDDEIRERMSGNICRCSAYPNIVAAIRDVAGTVT
jgi:xanthine dehydrogenase YagT iron-sulfur-binding subunit